MDDNKLKGVKGSVLFDEHHKMERFSLMFMGLVLVLSICYAMGVKAHFDNQKLYLSTQAIYTRSADWSLTKNTMNVIDLYRNDDCTKVFLLMKSENNMTDLPTNANDYSIFMTGDRGSSTKGNPKASVYVFADTGYIGLYFTESSGFSSALYNIVVRNTNVVKQGVKIDENTNNSFAKFNQLQLYMNLAGSKATVAEFLNKDEPSVEEIYSELLLDAQAADMRGDLNQTLMDMNNEMKRINDVTASLSSYGINVPALPESVNGDYITTDPELTKDNPMAFDYNMMNSISSIVSTKYNVTLNTESEEDIAKYKNDDVLYFVTDYVFPGGYQFNYQDISLTNGILDTLMADLPEGTTFKEFSESKSLESAEYIRDTAVRFDDWYYNTGNRFVYDASYASPEDTAIYNAINRYEASVTNLHNLKKKYQTIQLYNLLRLESSAKSVSNVFSVRSDAETLTLY